MYKVPYKVLYIKGSNKLAALTGYIYTRVLYIPIYKDDLTFDST